MKSVDLDELGPEFRDSAGLVVCSRGEGSERGGDVGGDTRNDGRQSCRQTEKRRRSVKHVGKVQRQGYSQRLGMREVEIGGWEDERRRSA